MRRPTTSLLVTMALAVTAVVFVAGSAAAAPPKKSTTTKTKTTKTSTTRSKATTSPTTTTTSASASSLDPNAGAAATGPGSQYSVINGTANAASDHVIVGSTAFPNYVTGAIDNYYSMAHSHVDNSPFAQGTASPLDTGPVGQTAAAGNFQQPQYADARWPGDDKSGKASYGTQGQPYAVANASEYNATAQASEASNALSGPSAPGGSNMRFATPVGFDGKLRQALAGWKAKWQGVRGVLPKRPAVPVPVPVPVPTPPSGKLPTPAPPVTTPSIPGVTTPSAPIGGANSPAPPVTVPSLPPVPRTASRSLASSNSPAAPSSSGSASGDGESLLESSTSSALDSKTGALVTSGESRLGRVSLGGGQIVIEGIHVSAMISNDGKGAPTYKVGVTVASATIGGVPVTIDQDGVHLAGQTQGVPYQQASDALNSALKNAGIQLFLVGPEISTNSCNGAGSGGSSSTTTTTTPSDGTNASSNSCAPASSFNSSPTSSCDSSGTGTTSTGQTTTSSTPSVTTPTPPSSTTTSKTTTTKTSTTSTTDTTSSCGQTGFSGSGSSSCTTGTTPSTTSSKNETGTTSSTTNSTTTSPLTPPSSGGNQTAAPSGTSSAGEMTIIATGLHVVFTQPAGAPAGVPAQNAEHILGEVYLDSLAVPGVPFSAGNFGDLNFNSNSNSPSSSTSGTSGSSCAGGVAGGSKSSGGLSSGGGLSAGGSNVAGGSLGSSGSGFGTSSQPSSSASGSPIGASLNQLASWVRHKPTWLLLSYLVWQALALAAAASLWKWQGEGAS